MRSFTLSAAVCFVVISLITPSKAQTYDGHWWFSANEDRQSGYLEGIADCMTWDVRRSGFEGTSQQLRDGITQYYKKHPQEKSKLVTVVWEYIWAKQVSKTKSGPPASGETWSKPHWYLDGNWWGQVTRETQKGFVDGYLSCTRSFVPAGREAYPLTNSHYFQQIDAFINSHPNSSKKPIALSLSRFRSVPQTN